MRYSWHTLNPPVGEDIDQDWLINWSMTRPFRGPQHNQAFLKLKDDNIEEDDQHDTYLVFDGASSVPEHGAVRYVLPEATRVELWDQDPDTGEWFLVGQTSELL